MEEARLLLQKSRQLETKAYGTERRMGRPIIKAVRVKKKTERKIHQISKNESVD